MIDWSSDLTASRQVRTLAESSTARTPEIRSPGKARARMGGPAPLPRPSSSVINDPPPFVEDAGHGTVLFGHDVNLLPWTVVATCWWCYALEKKPLGRPRSTETHARSRTIVRKLWRRCKNFSFALPCAPTVCLGLLRLCFDVRLRSGVNGFRNHPIAAHQPIAAPRTRPRRVRSIITSRTNPIEMCLGLQLPFVGDLSIRIGRKA
ncbi:unnamed protein product [Mycena citricolor]|uniref:Uncharacterized protein n=1 Tax=Mycena citricolor TaxID=2018698 RepID=A0AAD2H4R1_9AGAR|nr:unnamed protein product [Mycena citricolor]